jgi:hypothetical protein
MIKSFKQFNESNSDYINKKISEYEMNLFTNEPSLHKLVIDEKETPGTGVRIISGNEISYVKDVEDIINQYLD